MRDRQSTPDTKSHHSQPIKERETQRTTAQEEALVTQQDPLTQTISRIGIPPSAKVHANLLSRATADHPARGRQLMLQMQRQYGNRYVQRVLELSRQGAGETEATPEVEATIEQARGGGRSLDAGIQRQMESAFGNNFSGVRVHTDSTADALNQSLSARAFTTGQDIFFRQGEYNPGSSTGKELLAHELTHVVQQTGTVRGKLAIGEAGDRYEQEADKVASEVLQRLDAPAAVQRQEAIEEELQAKPEITALQRQEEPDEELQAKPSISALQRQEEAKNPNQTGLPDELKAGVENLSGYSLDDVRVHYNSSKPAQLQALAYTQGTEIHVGPGQEKHLAHEAWHVVQQMQGRVKPTMQMKGVQINDDEGMETEADTIGAKALQGIATKQAAHNAGTQAKLLVPKQLPIQRHLKVGPIVVQEEHVEFIYEKICQEARNILQMYQGATLLYKNSPTWIAYKKGIPQVLLDRKTAVKEIITRWAKSSGVGLPTITESVKEKFTGERGEKAEWKEFSDYLELALAIGYELDLDLQNNRGLEAELGAQIMKNDEIAQKLDVMRLKVMHWIVRQYQKDNTFLGAFKAKFRLGGSYNFSSQSKVERDFDALLEKTGLSVMDNIEILHDLMELTSDKGAGSFFQKFGKVLAPEVRESAYHQIGVDESNEIYEMRPMKTKSDHGLGGSAWKAAKHYTLKEFEVEFLAFENRMKDKVPDEFEMVEFDSPKDVDVLDPRSKKLTNLYGEKRKEKMSKALEHQRRAPETLLERLRDTLLITLDLKAKFKPTDQDVLHKRSKGRHNVGTRDEYDPVTVLARAHNVPIEAGRSMTTARILELCTKALNDDPEGRELHERGKSELDAVAQGIFAYWAAQYNQALTPIHTYHEVMDVARQYGVEYTPFHYKMLEAITMETKSLVPMDSDFTFKIPQKIELREERREQPYRITDSQRDKLSVLSRKAVWIDPNGDCLYNALSAVGAHIENVNQLRKDLAEFLLNNRGDYEGFIEDGNTVAEVAKQIARPGSYYNLGGDMTPLLIANYLKMPFTVMNEDGTYHHINGGNINRLVIRVTNPLPHFHSTKVNAMEIELTDLS